MCAPMMAIGLIGGVISAMGAIQAANAQAAGLKAQAQWQERQAAVEQMKTNYQIAQEKRRTKAMLGSQVAQYGAAGVDPTRGTPLDVAEATILERSMDLQARRIEGNEEVERNRYEASVSRMQAENAKKAGMINAMGSIVGAIGGAVGGMGGGGGGGAFQSAYVGAGTPQATPIAVTQPIVISGGGMVNAGLRDASGFIR